MIYKVSRQKIALGLHKLTLAAIRFGQKGDEETAGIFGRLNTKMIKDLLTRIK
jgi:hypothetical protein